MNSFQKSAEKVFIYDISGNNVIENFISVSKNNIKSYSYDLIICSNVLEHVSYPKNILSEISELMDEDTVLYIEVPYEKLMQNNSESKDKYLTKRHWHEHINFFSEKSIKTLITNAGFEVLNLKRHFVTSGGKSSHILQIACKLTC